jgi:ectoine hydroxylase-related dioxygenase (phytanoyl-CoA dioxygenase family)
MAKSLRTGSALRTLCHTGRIIGFFEQFLAGPVLPYRYIWVRSVRVGAATGVHFDWVYMGRGTPNLYTSWIPIGDVPVSDGPLMILERSHNLPELRTTYGQVDADRDRVFSNSKHRYAGGMLTKDAPALQTRFGLRWLTTDFQAGDLLVFGMFMLHCSLDNKSPENRIRLSVDARYQRASEPVDERWIGDDYFGDGMDDPVVQ